MTGEKWFIVNFLYKNHCRIKNKGYICTRKTVKSPCNKEDFVAQLVEQLTLNQWAVGSSPTEVTNLKIKLIERLETTF